jgi:hypothetical protein
VARWLLIIALVLAALLVASQLAVPPIAEHRIEDRLTEGGGSADASLSAFPAARLLFGDGEELSVTGSGLDLGLEQRTDVFDELDGFDRVDVSLSRFQAGPFDVARFDLDRPAPEAPYHLVSTSRTTAGTLAEYGASRLGLPGGPLLRFLTDQALGPDRPIPIDLDMELRAEGNRVIVVSGGGSVAGYPTGPLAELITATIAVRL